MNSIYPASSSFSASSSAFPVSSSASVATLSPGLATPAAPLGRGAKAAREFEAHLIGPLLESLEKTFATVPGEDSVPGADDYNYMGTQALAEVLAERGGFGIATMISRHLRDTRK
jgi:Rod binding domain-containing protein